MSISCYLLNFQKYEAIMEWINEEVEKGVKKTSVTPQRFREEKESIEMPVWVYK